MDITSKDMKGSGLQLPSQGKNTLSNHCIKTFLPFLTLALVIFSFCLSKDSSSIMQHLEISPKPHSPKATAAKSSNMDSDNKCNMFKGEWVPFPEGPYYTNKSKCVIDDRQNCMKFGRPDTGFMKWRWKPDDCELPLFDATQLLELVRGRTLAFIGDSLARNQMQSLVCLLSSVAEAEDVSREPATRWFYHGYNVTIIAFWSPHLVKATCDDPADPNGYSPYNPMNLYLDEADKGWADYVEDADVVIISAGQWFFRTFMYYNRGRIIGCHQCNKEKVARFSRYYGYRMAFRTAFRTLIELPNFKGMVFLRTFSPAHFENGEWDKGGNCIRTSPLTRQEVKLDGYILDSYSTQVEEFKASAREGGKRGLKFKLMDITELMLLRPDGHPDQYGHRRHENKTNSDCVHWCLPGPIDTWNQFLFQMLKNDRQGFAKLRKGPEELM